MRLEEADTREDVRVTPLSDRERYPDWTPATSRVVSGEYGPGNRFRTRTEARQYWSERTRIIEEYRVPGKWIFRIRREQ